MHPNTKQTLHIICDDLYDHTRSYSEINKGDLRDDQSGLKSYTAFFERIPKTKEKAYYYIYVIDLEKGTNELLFSYEQPEKKRMEINVKAKPKAKSSLKYNPVTLPSSSNTWITSNVTSASFNSLFDPLTPSIHPADATTEF